jgi:hypothetical protein
MALQHCMEDDEIAKQLMVDSDLDSCSDDEDNG